jgi:hypothetical protein
VKRSFALLALATLPLGAHAQEAAPLLTLKPVFAPGLYETEARNSHFQSQGVKSKTCIASADFDAFRREQIEQYRKSPQFSKTCRLSESKLLPDGFAFAMDCKETRIVEAVHFSKDLVRTTMRTEILAYPAASSDILILMRRLGDCPGQASGKDL